MVRFGGISGSFGLAMGILARLRLAKIRTMARPNSPDMPPKRTIKVRLGIFTVALFFTFYITIASVRDWRNIILFFLVFFLCLWTISTVNSFPVLVEPVNSQKKKKGGVTEGFVATSSYGFSVRRVD